MEFSQNILIILVIVGLVVFFALNRKKSKVIDSPPVKDSPVEHSDTDSKEIALDLEFWRAEHAKEFGPYNSDNLAPSDLELESYARQRIAGVSTR
jgi:hypothetical protein